MPFFHSIQTGFQSKKGKTNLVLHCIQSKCNTIISLLFSANWHVSIILLWFPKSISRFH